MWWSTRRPHRSCSKPKACPPHLWAVSFQPTVLLWKGCLLTAQVQQPNHTALYEKKAGADPTETPDSLLFPSVLHIIISSAFKPPVCPSHPHNPSLVLFVFFSFPLSGGMLSGKIIIYCVCISLLFAFFLSVSLHLPPHCADVLSTHSWLPHNRQECHSRLKSCLVGDSLLSPSPN